MTAIVSVMMITLGFLHGAIVATAVHTFQTQRILDKAIDEKFEADKRIDELEIELENEKQEKADLLNHLRDVVGYYSGLPPPAGPVERSKNCYGSDSDSEDDTFECPTSPDLTPDNKA